MWEDLWLSGLPVVMTIQGYLGRAGKRGLLSGSRRGVVHWNDDDLGMKLGMMEMVDGGLY